MKKIFEEFRGFIAKDNIVTLAVAVILGGPSQVS
nr:MscL family protein [Abiotrophia defectiva]